MEEWGETVLERTHEREAGEAEQGKRRVATLAELKEAGREEDEEAWDKATQRQRAYDDWADGVPKGSGVTKRI
jgi:hypothetical protein